MSHTCQASHRILALNDKDLHLKLGSDFDRKPIARGIDIDLECNFTGNRVENSSCGLKVLCWDHGDTKLCGSCPFCSMLADGMQQSVESDFWYSWNLSSKVGFASTGQNFSLDVRIHFEQVQYQKHRPYRSPQNTKQPWEVDILCFVGYVLVPGGSYGSEACKCGVSLAFELFGAEDDPIVHLLGLHRRPYAGLRLSDEKVAKIQGWIMDCNENHERCFPDSENLADGDFLESPASLPTRLIDVGESSTNGHPRLVITSEMAIITTKEGAAKYMALSYCWGKVDDQSKLLRTTHDTIQSRMEKIEIGTKPQTFQDTIVVARTLNIRYLWIDSLCIIQDDERD